MDELFASIQQDLAGLANRLAAVEARLDRGQAVASGRPLVLPDECFQAMEAAAARVAPTTTVDGLSPVEPAPHAPQGVTQQELESLIAFGLVSVGDNAEEIAASLWNHPRIGPLLRGKGATVPVVLPEEPPFSRLPYVEGPSDEEDLVRAVWAAARAEVARQQGGQADG